MIHEDCLELLPVAVSDGDWAVPEDYLRLLYNHSEWRWLGMHVSWRAGLRNNWLVDLCMVEDRMAM